MGLIHPGPPWDFVLLMKDAMRLAAFVETGTFEGSTAEIASRHFAQVVTIELSPQLHIAAERRLSHLANVDCLLGDSRRHLSYLVQNLFPSVFYLDAHWTGHALTAGKDDECPLLGEIEVLEPHLDKHLLLIDDANLFLSPPPAGHKTDHWPDIAGILDRLRKIHRPYIAIFDDVICVVPEPHREAAIDILVNLATRRDFDKRAGKPP
jgi:hypothetical protein